MIILGFALVFAGIVICCTAGMSMFAFVEGTAEGTGGCWPEIAEFPPLATEVLYTAVFRRGLCIVLALPETAFLADSARFTIFESVTGTWPVLLRDRY